MLLGLVSKNHATPSSASPEPARLEVRTARGTWAKRSGIGIVAHAVNFLRCVNQRSVCNQAA
jgi:hypothetical protein